MSDDPRPLVHPNHPEALPRIDPGAAVFEFLEAKDRITEAIRFAEQKRDNELRIAQKENDRFITHRTSERQVAELEAEKEFEHAKNQLHTTVEQKLAQLKQTHDSIVKRIRQELSSSILNAEKARDEAIWHASTAADGETSTLESRLLNLRRHYVESENRLDTFRIDWGNQGLIWPNYEELSKLSLDTEEGDRPTLLDSAPHCPEFESIEKSFAELQAIESSLNRSWPRLLFRLPFVLLWLAAGIGFAAVLSIDVVAISIGCLAIFLTGYFITRRDFGKKGIIAVDRWLQCRQLLTQFGTKVDHWYDESRQFIDTRLEETRSESSSKAKRAVLIAQDLADSQLTKATNQFESATARIKEQADLHHQTLQANFDRRCSSIQNEFEKAIDESRRNLERRSGEISTEFRFESERIRSEWLQKSAQARKLMNEWSEWRFRCAPDWERLLDNVDANQPAGALLLGSARVAPDDFWAHRTFEDKVRDQNLDLNTIPLVRYIPGPKSTIWIQAPPGRRTELSGLLQTLALRSLTSFAPGQLRFTLIDPIGLGQTFAGLLHLSDFEPALVNQRPWTEAKDIEARLAELTMHLEFVVQNYLRNQYATIEDYNKDADEVAEAYRLLIIADWPNAISDESAQRLRRLIEAGARCGIYVIIGQDLTKPGPVDPTSPELRPQIDRILWSADKGRWSWPNHPLDSHEVRWIDPPDSALVTKIVRRFGAAAKESMRVEVPFSIVAPPDREIWNRSSAHGLEIPLGRAGARQLQSLNIGEGTAQHLLLAGRTGSGKSTLLHAIVTNAALRYSPDELVMYLVDFKKGVEFKNYAARDLPHARVVAVESEREFGLSVLERLDRELTIRGERFRRAGVQDMAGFRAASPDEHLPRILLVIDEFQELFNDDDRLASDAANLLDRLVRQGRAFGIHAVLGSQSMAGAYAIARSTLGQMGVRIALQCTENDSRLILSEDNPAARMLSRPGEAIYNDANGLPEGNHMFQAVWISDQDRETQLTRIHEAATHRRWTRDEPMIVFEGNLPGDLRRHPVLIPALSDVSKAEDLATSNVPMMWFGESVTISEPPAIRFDRQPAANVLVIGRQAPEIRAMMVCGILGLAVSGPRSRILILESPSAGEPGLKTLLRGLSRRTRLIDPTGLKTVIAELRAELHERHDDPSKSADPVFLIIADLARLRDLRKSEDDFGFGGFGSGDSSSPSPTKMLAEIIRDGPSVGIHTILWTDGSTSFGHSTDRTAINEFGTLVIFQTNASESTHFLDNVAASRLDRSQALLVRTSEGETSKIRPYAMVDNDLWDKWASSVH